MENVIGNINSTTDNNGNIIVKGSNSIFCESFYFQDYLDEKMSHKFIKSTEAIIRQSKEYNDYLALLKTNYNILNFDNVLSHISSSDASIEIHHYPLTLFEIVDIIMTYHVAKKENFTSFSIAKEVMNLHFNQKIGFVPLSKTNHELAHADGLFISFKQVFGDWRKFCLEYRDGISEEIKEKLNKLDELSSADMASDFKELY